MGRSMLINEELIDVDAVANMYYISKETKSENKDTNKLDNSIKHRLAIRFKNETTAILYIDNFNSKQEVIDIIKECNDLKNRVEKNSTLIDIQNKLNIILRLLQNKSDRRE